jgi:protein involved in ribonucleotide reduction
MMAHIPRPRTIPPKNDNPSNPFLGSHGVDGVVGVGEDDTVETVCPSGVEISVACFVAVLISVEVCGVVPDVVVL